MLRMLDTRFVEVFERLRAKAEAAARASEAGVNEELRRIAEVPQELLAIVSYDLPSPLGAIMGAALLVQAEPTNPIIAKASLRTTRSA